jgi:signal transduction histidine kinase
VVATTWDLAAAVSLLIALALVSWAVVRALDTTARAWLAALLVGVAWLVLAGMLFVRGRRDLRAWRSAHPHADQLRERAEAEADARTSLEALFDLLAGELARHEEQRLARAAGHELKTVEQELRTEATVLETDAHQIEARAATALQELVEIVTLPGRAGINALRRLTNESTLALLDVAEVGKPPEFQDMPATPEPTVGRAS